MMANDLLALLMAGTAGLLLGAIFFGGLLWTVHSVVSSPWPALWVFASLLARMGMVLAGFYIVADGHWQRLLACLAGFAAARLAVTWLNRPSEEASHAP